LKKIVVLDESEMSTLDFYKLSVLYKPIFKIQKVIHHKLIGLLPADIRLKKILAYKKKKHKYR
jgi:hypothetical protein